jgi:hypothetical protein
MSVMTKYTAHIKFSLGFSRDSDSGDTCFICGQFCLWSNAVPAFSQPFS